MGKIVLGGGLGWGRDDCSNAVDLIWDDRL